MDQLYLVDGRVYTFNIYNNYFANRELIIVDENSTEITTGVTNTWAFKSGREYQGNITRDGNIVYQEGTKKQLQKIRIEFTADINYNKVYLVGRTGSDLSQPMQIYADEGALIDPDKHKFIVAFRHSDDFNSSTELVNSFVKTMIPAGLIVEYPFDVEKDMQIATASSNVNDLIVRTANKQSVQSTSSSSADASANTANKQSVQSSSSSSVNDVDVSTANKQTVQSSSSSGANDLIIIIAMTEVVQASSVSTVNDVTVTTTS